MKEKTKWSIFLIIVFVLTIAGGVGCGFGTVALFKPVPLLDEVMKAVHIVGGLLVAIWGLGFVIAFIALIAFLVFVYRETAKNAELQKVTRG